MIIITSSDTLQAVLSDSMVIQPRAIVCYREISVSALTPGTQITALNSTTDVNILTSPPSSTHRLIDYISCQNINTSSINLTIKIDTAGVETILWSGSLDLSESIYFTESAGWTKINSIGLPLSGLITSAAFDLQSFTSTGNGVWVKPTNFLPTLVRVICYGGGGGGGGGATHTGAFARYGGCGGGGGARASRLCLANELSSTEALFVGSGGSGGLGAIAPSTAGTDGGIGGATTFSSGQKLLSAFGGGGGYRGSVTAEQGFGGGGGGLASSGSTGTNSAANGGLPGFIIYPNSNNAGGGQCGTGLNVPLTYAGPESGGGEGGSHTAAASPGTGGHTRFGGAGGGCGTPITSAPVTNGVGHGGAHYYRNWILFTGAPILGGSPGLVGALPTQGKVGAAGLTFAGGTGGGGGGGTVTTNISGQQGGAGAAGGGGGGGGGAGEGSGAGNDGAPGGSGAVYVLSW